ncbi:hypothetical protein IGI04_023554, partial [Brassica rapa subsp. trilocularis]
MEHSVLFSLLGLSEEHPQYVGNVSFLERCLATFSFRFLKVLPIVALSTCIGSGASSECVLVVSGGLAKGFGCGMSALIRAMLIFGNCTRNVRGARLGGCGCLAANSSWATMQPTLWPSWSCKSPFTSCTRTKFAAITRGSVSIDVRDEVSINVGWKISVDGRLASVDGGERVWINKICVWVDSGWQVSIDKLLLLSIDEE